MLQSKHSAQRLASEEPLPLLCDLCTDWLNPELMPCIFRRPPHRQAQGGKEDRSPSTSQGAMQPECTASEAGGRVGPHALEHVRRGVGTCHSLQPCLSSPPTGPGKAIPCPFPKQAGRLWASGQCQRLQVCLPGEQASRPLIREESALTLRRLRARPAEAGEKARCLVRWGGGHSCHRGQLPRARKPLLKQLASLTAQTCLRNVRKDKTATELQGASKLQAIICKIRWRLHTVLLTLGLRFFPIRRGAQPECSLHFTDGETEAQDREVPQRAKGRSRTGPGRGS